MTVVENESARSDIDRVIDLADRLLEDMPPSSVPPEKFLGEQFDRGLAWVHFPEGLGGMSLSPSLQRSLETRLAEGGAPSPSERNVIGHGMVAPTLIVHGTDEQKRLLRPLFTGEEVWCQLFSEPSAGSDVASLAARAVRDGDEWILNGQKVWTTLAHVSRWGLLITRTNPDLPKHQGMTVFLLDMHLPGVDVRPLYQITGEAEFNEVFFSDVRVPDSDRLDGVGQGWRVALTTLMNERVSIGGGTSRHFGSPMTAALRLWEEHWKDDDSAHAAALRDRLMSLWVKNEVVRMTNLRSANARKAGTPGPDGSVAKISFAELNQQISELCVDLLGAQGMLYESDYPKIRPAHAGFSANVQKMFLRARANSIEGGTSEVMRNILGERVLGLAGEPRVDKEIPWKDVLRS